jgi:hypothetical protein
MRTSSDWQLKGRVILLPPDGTVNDLPLRDHARNGILDDAIDVLQRELLDGAIEQLDAIKIALLERILDIRQEQRLGLPEHLDFDLHRHPPSLSLFGRSQFPLSGDFRQTGSRLRPPTRSWFDIFSLMS